MMIWDLHCHWRGEPLLRLAANGRVWFEISMLEGVGGVSNLLAQLPMKQTLFGSHAPLFSFESALLKPKESPFTEDQSQAIREANARQLRAAPGETCAGMDAPVSGKNLLESPRRERLNGDASNSR